MHNLCPNPRNYLGRSFSHILRYLQTLSLPNIRNCDTTYQLPYLRFIDLYLWIQRYQRFLHHNRLIAIASATSPCSHTIGLFCTTAHNTAPHVYTAQGYTSINSAMIRFDISNANHNSTNYVEQSLLDPYRKDTYFLHSLFTKH